MDKEFILKCYEKMSLIRLAEEKISEEYFNDEMKTPVHLSIGEEAIPVGVLACLPKNTDTYGTYRSHALYLSKTDDLNGFFCELYGKETGVCRGKAGSMHLMNYSKGVIATSAVVSTTIPVAVGGAFSKKYKKSEDYVVVFFGDGATEEGVFWESLNFAALHQLKVLFVCEDNELAIHSLPKTRRGFESFNSLFSGLNISTLSGDGTNLGSVVDATKSILSDMKENNRPGFLHLKYFRHLEHVGPLEDYKFGYRECPDDIKTKLDPIWNIKNDFSEYKDEFDKIDDVVKERIEESVKKAQTDPFPAANVLFEDVIIERH